MDASPLGVRADLPHAEGHRPGCGVALRPSRRSKRRAWVLLAVHALVFAHLLHWRLAGRTLTPLEPSEAGETLVEGVVNAGFVLLALSIGATLVFGRFFCGWACHVVAIQDACAWLLARLGLRPKPVRSRLLVFVPLFAALEMFAWPSVERLARGAGFPGLSVHLTTDSLWERFPGPWMAAATLAVDGFLLVWLLGAKGFCTYGCPYGALFGLSERVARGRIRVSDACEQCGHCTATCTSNVRVHEEVARFGMVVDPGCMKCMDCVSVCPKGALRFGFGSGKPRGAGGRGARRHDFSWPEELAMAVVFLGSLYAFRGLYGAVPFLLAIGLSVIAAVATVLAARLLARPEMTLQHIELKRARRLTSRGAMVLAAALVFLGGTAHSALVQVERRAGQSALERAGALAPGQPGREELLHRSARRLERALRLSLVDSSELHNMIGQIRGTLGEGAAARRHLGRAVELDPNNSAALVWLGQLELAAGEREAACERFVRALETGASDEQTMRAVRRALERFGSEPGFACAGELRARLLGLR